MINNKLTYITLFSSAGVGCYGFKKAGYECIATNELIERRLNVQKINKKCKFETGYICGDIKQQEIKNRISSEINRWSKLGNDKVDVVIATPPCQGMSVANHKKAENEIIRNSLVVESIKLIKQIKPRVFIFENVAAFIKTGCTAPDGTIKEIGKVINEELGNEFIIYNRILNFKNYGSNSSRTRTLVIGVSKEIQNIVTPMELFPDYCKEKTLKQVIGNMKELEWGEIDKNDFYHQFRTYPEHMRNWIHNVKQGDSAFDNENIEEVPHKIVDGKIVLNKNKNGDKYTRQCWNKVAPCIHTRNDQIASQNTIHPEQDRVFSIRELMKLMTIPDEFKWIDININELNKLSIIQKRAVLKKEEINIRQSIGEAVPTIIFNQVAEKIKEHLINNEKLNIKQIEKIIKDNELYDIMNLKGYIKKSNYNYTILSQIAELANSKRKENSAYYTNKFIINEIMKKLPEFSKKEIKIIEPSVGVGNFIPLLIKKYDYIEKISIDLIEIDKDNVEILKLLLEKIKIPKNININIINADFLEFKVEKKYDLCIGNPPFTKLNSKDKKLKKYMQNSINKDSTNLVAFFWEKAISIADVIALVSPKGILSTPEYKTTREIMAKYSMTDIIDNGELGFKGVLIETICIIINKMLKIKDTNVYSLTFNKAILQKQKYITSNEYPYWLIYRTNSFDDVAKKMEFDIFKVFRDRQLTNSNTVNEYKDNYVRVLKSRDIDDYGKNIINIKDYDSYIEKEKIANFSVSKFLNMENVYLTPNMTYKPRVMRKPNGVITNGSIAILIPKDESIVLSDSELEYFSTDEYREFYKIARNFQTRSLNIDNNSVFFFRKI